MSNTTEIPIEEMTKQLGMELCEFSEVNPHDCDVCNQAKPDSKIWVQMCGGHEGSSVEANYYACEGCVVQKFKDMTEEDKDSEMRSAAQVDLEQDGPAGDFHSFMNGPRIRQALGLEKSADQFETPPRLKDSDIAQARRDVLDCDVVIGFSKLDSPPGSWPMKACKVTKTSRLRPADNFWAQSQASDKLSARLDKMKDEMQDALGFPEHMLLTAGYGTPSLDGIRRIAMQAHKGQFRRDGVTPYTEHLRAVATRVSDDPEAEMVAWLHDILEDTRTTSSDLRAANVPEPVVQAVWLLTRDPMCSYTDYIAKIKGNALACRVKIADMLANLSDRPTNRQILKYAKALLLLVDSTDGYPTDVPEDSIDKQEPHE